jgi:hypothetical protein
MPYVGESAFATKAGIQRPNLQNPNNPVPFLDLKNPPRVKAGGG